jgi:MarR family transcriptional regulator, organic hydroperoxide resistance regulator
MATESLVEDLILLSRLLRFPRRSDMTSEQYWLLRHLRNNGPQSISELAHALEITSGSATVACKRLEKAGFITRERSSDDERVVQVTLTELGRNHIEAGRRQRRESITGLLAGLDQDEQQELQRLVERLLQTADIPSCGGIPSRNTRS